jgi:transcription antitermination factor NusG
MDESPWNVIHVVAKHEKRVAQHLAARSIEHYLPLYAERSKWSDRTVVLERPLFTGYVFVRFSPHSRLPIISIPGVIRLLGDTAVDTVDPEEVATIREGLAKGHILRPHPFLLAGTRVRIRAGIFSGVEGIVTTLRPSCRVILLVSAIQQCFSLEIGLEHLDVLKPANLPRPVLSVASLGQ